MKDLPAIDYKTGNNFKSVQQFCEDNISFRPGGVRHMIFHHGPELIAEGAMHKYGSRIFINQKRWFELLETGFFDKPTSRSARI